MPSIHSGHRGRVKTEFLARGMEGWPDHRVLELLLFYAIPQGDVNALAHTLINHFGSLSGVFDAAPEELKKVPGIGEHTALLLKLIPAVGQRYVADRSGRGDTVYDGRDAMRILYPYFYGARHEMIYVLCLDSKHKVLGVRKIAEGGIESAEVNVRGLVETVMSMNAAAIYIAHNHISNLAVPSIADWSSTDVLRSLLKQMEIDLVDHIVFSDDDSVSLRESELYGGRTIYKIT